MGEYMPETLAALQGVLDGLQLTNEELALISAFRDVAKTSDVVRMGDRSVVAPRGGLNHV